MIAMTFEQIIRATQASLIQKLPRELNKLGYNAQVENGFIYAEGTVPVLLVAHMDTVHEKNGVGAVEVICYSKCGRYMMSPQGIGGDDRCGIYMILEIVKEHKCHVLFCEDEEIGGVGASAFAASGIMPAVNYAIEFDRRGTNDAVFYDCDNKEFTEFILEHEFEEAHGSFSDISVVAPRIGVAAVNLSSGYFSEHTKHEMIDMEAVENNIRRGKEIVVRDTAKFEYVESVYGGYGRYGRGVYDYDDYYGFNRGTSGGRYAGYSSGGYNGYYKNNTAKIYNKTYGKYDAINDEDYDDETKAYLEGTSAEPSVYDKSEHTAMKTLMPLPDTAYVKLEDGDFAENRDSQGEYFIDDMGRVFRYLYSFDVAISQPDCEAYSEHGLHASFNFDDALPVAVASISYGIELENMLMETSGYACG